MNTLYNYFFPDNKPIEVTEARKIYEQQVIVNKLNAEKQTSKNLNECYINIRKMINAGQHNFTWCPCLTNTDISKIEKLGYMVTNDDDDDDYYYNNRPGHFVYLYDKQENEK